MTAPNVSPLEMEVATLIVNTLRLKINPIDVNPDQPLFREGLGLDSIDALELSLAVSQTYGYELRSSDPDIKIIFASLRNLCRAIDKHRTK